jgi:hypothetical protein
MKNSSDTIWNRTRDLPAKHKGYPSVFSVRLPRTTRVKMCVCVCVCVYRVRERVHMHGSLFYLAIIVCHSLSLPHSACGQSSVFTKLIRYTRGQKVATDSCQIK